MSKSGEIPATVFEPSIIHVKDGDNDMLWAKEPAKVDGNGAYAFAFFAEAEDGKTYKKSFLGASIAMAGSPAAGVLLHRMDGWYSSPKKVKRNGHEWIVFSLARWSFDTHLTHKQLRAAFAVLKKRGLIVSERHLLDGKSARLCALISSSISTKRPQ